jgi:hypothetical protein
MLPKRLANHSGQQILKEVSEVWESLTRGNKDVPPLCQSAENHPSHLIFNPLFLGLLKTEVRKGTFFEQCVKLTPFKIPFYPFSSLAYLKKYVIFHHNDAGHIQKSFARALRTKSRGMRSGTLRINLGVLTMRNIPKCSFAGRDLQSDKEAAHLLCPKYCNMQAWDRHGLCLMMYTASLTTGQWLASKAFDPETILENSLCGYFLTMLDMWSSWKACANKNWHKHTWSLTTCRNIVFCCGHLIERCLRHPPDVPFEPAMTMEVPWRPAGSVTGW